MHPNHPKAKAHPYSTRHYVCERVDCRVESVTIRINCRDRAIRSPLCPMCQKPMHAENKPTGK